MFNKIVTKKIITSIFHVWLRSWVLLYKRLTYGIKTERTNAVLIKKSLVKKPSTQKKRTLRYSNIIRKIGIKKKT